MSSVFFRYHFISMLAVSLIPHLCLEAATLEVGPDRFYTAIEDAYIDAVSSKGANLQLLLKKGKILFEARRNQAAIAVFDECLSMNPNVWEAYIMKGWAAWDLKDWKAAKRAFTMALSSKKYKAQAKDALDMLDSLDEARSK